jgi:hypothetical protein
MQGRHRCDVAAGSSWPFATALIDVMTELAQQAIGFQSLQETINTITPYGTRFSYLRRPGRVRAQSHPRARPEAVRAKG